MINKQSKGYHLSLSKSDDLLFVHDVDQEKQQNFRESQLRKNSLHNFVLQIPKRITSWKELAQFYYIQKKQNWCMYFFFKLQSYQEKNSNSNFIIQVQCLYDRIHNLKIKNFIGIKYINLYWVQQLKKFISLRISINPVLAQRFRKVIYNRLFLYKLMKNNKLNSYEVEETRYRINKLIEYK
ncbi:unnamed protein product [Paramecium primaurelia]|nr:unnamed protein product [Paramecium primaurelia]